MDTNQAGVLDSPDEHPLLPHLILLLLDWTPAFFRGTTQGRGYGGGGGEWDRVIF